MVKIREILCSSALQKSGISDYSLNCYVGCEHNCRYCYARFMKRFTNHDEEWGEFVDIRINIVDVLKKEIKKKKIGEVFLSSVCDGWQPQEEKRMLTRECLEILLRYGFKVNILTKSALVQRDFDLMKKNVLLGVTITTLNEKVKKIFEPNSPRCEERLTVIEECSSKNIPAYVFFGPILPNFSDSSSEIEKILKRLKEFKLDFIYVDVLNPRWGVYSSLKKILLKEFPDLLGLYRRILFNEGERKRYITMVRNLLIRESRNLALENKLRFCF